MKERILILAFLSALYTSAGVETVDVKYAKDHMFKILADSVGKELKNVRLYAYADWHVAPVPVGLVFDGEQTKVAVRVEQDFILFRIDISNLRSSQKTETDEEVVRLVLSKYFSKRIVNLTKDAKAQTIAVSTISVSQFVFEESPLVESCTICVMGNTAYLSFLKLASRRMVHFSGLASKKNAVIPKEVDRDAVRKDLLNMFAWPEEYHKEFFFKNSKELEAIVESEFRDQNEAKGER